MDTGILSIIMNLLPWQFRGLGILATIMFVWNFVLFSCFALFSIARLFRHASHVKNESMNALEEQSYLAAPAIAYLTLVAQVSLTCSTAWGYNWTILAYVLWWIGLVWTVTLCSSTVVLLTKRNITNDHQMSPVILLPLIGVMTQGTTAGIIVNYSAGMNATLAIPLIIVSFLTIGYAFFLSLLYYAIYMHRLLVEGPPQQVKLASMIVTIGPMGQFATAIQLLSQAANSKQYFVQYNQGTFLTASAASNLATSCELCALMIIGSGFLWITVAWYMVTESLFRRNLPYSLTCWSMIFPMGKIPSSIFTSFDNC
jgi:tellurite resistance protein TehA-like permease